MNTPFNQIIYNWGPIVSGLALLAVGYINGQVRLLGTTIHKYILPKIALLLLFGFMCLLANAYFSKRSISPSDFFSIFFFWTIAPYYAGIGLFTWSKSELWFK
jgi:hypothetical protein